METHQDIINLWNDAGFTNEHRYEMLTILNTILPFNIARGGITCGDKARHVLTLETRDDIEAVMDGRTNLGIRFDITNLYKFLTPSLSCKEHILVTMMLSGLCQSAESPICQKYWDDFDIAPKQSDYVTKNEIKRCLLEASKKMVMNDNKVAYYKYYCTLHKRQHIAIKKVQFDRKLYDGLNEIFPPTSKGDWAHTRLNVKTVLCTMSKLNTQRKQAALVDINFLLTLFPVSSYNSLVTGLMIAVVDLPPVQLMLRSFKERKWCCMNKKFMMSTLKIYSNCVRRTHTAPGVQVCDVNHITACSYWYMCSSRQLSISNWDKERTNRQNEIRLNNVCGYDFRRATRNNVSSSIQRIIKEAKVPSSWYEYVMKRQRNISSRSTGGLKTLIGDKTITAGKMIYFENIPTEEVLKWID
ncbi:hypothetical protein GJ496_001441 [Pomphorhynchus laevis]|nr:hypothetical protein GJ496_001436 [Pomphorhynchus laevis]KAI0980756.1 hypothetical protein GJ496_001438 [Pomphorhynchus laevis]KAI0980759.1 hypothetical protein GJ496_001441 [Pomphorhynchus laevis]